MKTRNIFILTISILLGGLSGAKATNRFVSVDGAGDGSSWVNAKGSIQSALWDCVAGDTVFVASGLYYEIFSVKDGVCVLGGYNAATSERDFERFETIVDGTDKGKYIIVKYDNDCTQPTIIEGLTLQNAEHTSEGGAAYIRGNVILDNCIIRNCTGSNGGGVCINGAGVVRNCIIELCSATSSGGAIRNKGGLVENCVLRGNQGKYGTIRNDAGTVRNCVIYNNSASVSGWPNSGGIYNPGGRVENCIIARNYGSQYAALHSDAPTLNTICWGNAAEEGFAEPLAYVADTSTVSARNAADSGFAKAKSALTLSKENMAANGPQFKSPTNFVGVPTNAAEIAAMRAADWTFMPTSPCIDKGTSNGVPAYDILGVARPKGTAYDLGAYEYDPDAKTVAVTGVQITLDTLTLEEEQQMWLSAIVLPSNATNKRVTWKSLNTSIATIEGGQVTGIAIGQAKVVATTEDGGFADTCVIVVIEKPIVIIHPDVLAADALNMDDYTVPSWTKMLVAKEAARADSSEVNLNNLKTAIAALINKNMPYSIVANINGDPQTRMAFAWFTNANMPAGKVQIVAKADATAADFATPTFTFEATTKQAKLNYAVSTSGILKAAAMPTGTKREYTSHKAIATGLTANTTYSYRVGQEGYWSEIRSFTTAAAGKDKFKFLYMTDSHIMDAEYVENARWAATTAAKHAPDARFMIFTGDFVETGTAQNSEWEWEQWFDVSMTSLLAKVPLAPTDGNHDDTENLNYTHHINTDNSFNKVAKVKPQFDGITYSFVYGDALFMIYSHQDYWRGSYNNTAGTCKYLSEDVAPWFREQVAAHPNVKWRIAAVHKNLFTGSGHQADSDGALFRATLLPVFEELNMDLIIQGHDHVYEVIGPIDNATKTLVPNSISDVKTVPVLGSRNATGKEGGVFDVSEGTMYFVNGTCGRKRYDPYTEEEMLAKEDTHKVPNYWSLFSGKFGQPGAPAFSEITVTTDTITVSTYTANSNQQATLFDSYRIVKTASAGLVNATDGKLDLYPCPATDIIRLNKEAAKVQVYDTTGRLAHTLTNTSTIDVSTWKQGVYMISATDKKGVVYNGRVLKR